LPLPFEFQRASLVNGLSGNIRIQSFSAALDEPRDRYASRFDLPVGNPGRLHRFQSVLAERERARRAKAFPVTATALLFAVLNFFSASTWYWTCFLKLLNFRGCSRFFPPRCGIFSPWYTQHFTPITPYVVCASAVP